MQWIALHFPSLPLEALLRGSPSPEAWAVFERDRVLHADRKARARGVVEGMRCAAAGAIASRLRLIERDPAAETEALLGAATWCTQFTPGVVLEFPQAIALEVSASLKLFGGLEGLRKRLREGMEALGFTVRMSGAPTVQAALWLARAGHPPADGSSLAEALGPVDVAVLDLDAPAATLLERLGIRSLGELMALPRDGLARRLGQDVLDRLDRALGRLPDPRNFYVPPPRFFASIELQAEVIHAEALQFAARRLLVQLEGYLAARMAGVRQFRLRLSHREGQATVLTVGLMAPARNAAHFQRLLQERLGATRLRDPVRAITLEADDIQPFAGATPGLLPDDRQPTALWGPLIERLRARLGDEQVNGLAQNSDHRPERATRRISPDARAQLSLPLGDADRPFWLLEAPRPIDEIDSTPHYGGPLVLLAGPERIESGWWDGNDVVRDYFVARTPSDSLLWVFRDHAHQGSWYLHGVFS